MATTTNYGWTTPDDTALVKDGASAIRSLGSSIDTTTKALNPSTSLGDIEYRSSTANTNTRLPIGSSGQNLTVVGGVPSWAPSATSVLSATGDLLYASAANTLDRRAIGTTGQVLTVSGGLPVWATPAGGGKILQVVQGTRTTNFSTTSTSYVDAGISVSITPSATTSRILVMTQFDGTVEKAATGTSCTGTATLLRGSTNIQTDTYGFIANSGTNKTYYLANTFVYVDSPATTSSTTYKIQVANSDSDLFFINATSAQPAVIIAMEIGA